MNRRGLFAAFALSPVMAVEAFAKEQPSGQPDSNQIKIIIQGTKKPEKQGQSGSVLTLGGWSNPDPSKQVSMSVGEDGHLWIKTSDGPWKRVVTE